jgi:hypothetical protein
MGAEPDSDDSADPGAGVFGNLPSSRPGTRSPRRESAADKQPAAKPKARAKAAPPKAAAAPKARRPDPVADAEAVAAATTPPAPDAEPKPESPDQESNRSGLEDIAWAGVAAAADAATIGVRLASRALERLRDGVDRR